MLLDWPMKVDYETFCFIISSFLFIWPLNGCSFWCWTLCFLHHMHWMKFMPCYKERIAQMTLIWITKITVFSKASLCGGQEHSFFHDFPWYLYILQSLSTFFLSALPQLQSHSVQLVPLLLIFLFAWTVCFLIHVSVVLISTAFSFCLH